MLRRTRIDEKSIVGRGETNVDVGDGMYNNRYGAD